MDLDRGMGLRWATTRYGRFFAVPGAGLASFINRMSAMVVVALARGFLARSVLSRVVGERPTQRAPEHRVDLLHIVARVSRSMSAFDTNQVISAVVDASVEIGFESVAILVLDEGAQTYSMAAGHGFDDGITRVVRPSSEGVIGLVRESRKTVVVDDYQVWTEAVPDFGKLGYRAVIATPIWRSGELYAVLAVLTRKRDSVSPNEIEALELLAAQAGAALTTASHFTERQALKAQVQLEALHDSLTGLPNRTLFQDRLDHFLERKATSPSATAIAFIDLDGFKHVNDSYGQKAGDELLRVVAGRLLALRAPGDTVARYGADQFAILIEEPPTQRAVMDIATKIVEEIQQPMTIAGGKVYISASVGVSFCHQMERLARDFLCEADLAMRRAKERGGCRVESYRPVMSTRVRYRSEIERDIRRALDRDELIVYYQPEVSLETGAIVGLEALVRWQHPERGLLTADDFIPYAQETGLITAIGQRLLDEVGAQISVWRSTGSVPAVPVGVNLSATEFEQQDFVARVASVLDAHRLHPDDIIFEVTEGVVMRDDGQTRQQIRGLEQIGVRLAIDDFGLGYSSLNYLKQFPFSLLKIDRSFVRDIVSRETDQAIVRYILALARDLGMPAVAEGVETEEQLEFLRGIGCRFVQGYYVCRPVHALRLRDLVANGVIGSVAPNVTNLPSAKPAAGQRRAFEI